MKKLLLIASALIITVGLSAQKSPAKLKPGVPTVSNQLYNIDEEAIVKTPSIVSLVERPEYRATSDITVLNIGNAANAYGLYNGGRTAVWADPNTNSVSFAHRMLASPGSGYLAYDLSKDGGNTWTSNNQVFDPTVAGTANARYPQGIIYNPAGNTNPDNAYFSFFAPTLDGTNGTAGSWGGYCGGTVKLDGTGLSQVGWSSHPPIRHNVPDAMTVNPVTGDVFVVESSLVGGLGNQYLDSLLITHGVFNASLGKYEYEQSLLYAPSAVAYGGTATAVSDTRIAFAPDGMTGYIMILGDNGGDLFATGLSYYPILYKTTDGGLNWDESPMSVTLGGPDGIPGIVNELLTDDQIAELFLPPLPNRDEIAYTTAFTSDFCVDMFGNPVISITIGIASSDTPYSIVASGGFGASYNIFSQDGGQTWLAHKFQSNKTFRGTFGDVDEDTRSQLTTTPDGSKMFFSWLDTDFEGVTDNIQPDIFCVGWDIATNTYTAVTNVTFLSDAWLQAFMGTASYYALVDETGGAPTYTIPFVYQAMDPTDPTLPVQYKYIPDFKFAYGEFVNPGVGPEKPANNNSVSQNFPNPFNGTSEIKLNLAAPSMVSLEVFNLMGQKVKEIPACNLQSGNHTLTIDANGMKSGVYAYSVNINGEKVTRKMIVK